MNLEKWLDIKSMAKDKFKVLSETEEVGEDSVGTVQLFEFEGPLGRMKLEFISKPRILDKKTTYSNRIGSEMKVNYVYSEDEVVHQLHAYKWNETTNDWEEIDAAAFA